MDLVELALVVGQYPILEALFEVVMDDDVQYLPRRVRTRGPLIGVLADIRDGHTDEVADDIRGARGRVPRPLDFRLTVAEAAVRAGLEPSRIPRVPARLRTPRARSAAVGLGLAFVERNDQDRGRSWLTSAAEEVERAWGGKPDSLPETLAGAFDTWTWARALLGVAQTGPDARWLVDRLPACARFFSETGHPRWAAKAETLLAGYHERAGNHVIAARLAGQAITRWETRFLEVGSLAAIREWRAIGREAAKIGLSATTGGGDRRVFLEFEPRTGWLGEPAKADERAVRSAARVRRLFRSDDVRSTYIEMLGLACETLDAGGAGGPLIDELVEMLREDVAEGRPPTLLARALTLRAHHRHTSGLPRAALADDVEARALLVDTGDAEEIGRADEYLEQRLDALVDKGDWTAAVRTAVAFDGSEIDPTGHVEGQARLRGRDDVVEQVAAFRVELAREGNPRELVAALSEWAVSRERLGAGAGTPVFTEAIALAEALPGHAEEDLAALVEVRLVAARYRADPELGLLLRRVLGGPFARLTVLAELTDTVAGDSDLDPNTAVDLLVEAAERLLAAGPPAGRGVAWTTNQVMRWAAAMHRLHAPLSAADLYRALTGLPGQLGFLAVSAHRNLAEALADAGEAEAAVAAAKKAVELDPESAGGRLILGRTLLECARLQEAKEELDVSLQLEPASSYGHNLRAKVLHKLGNIEGALVDLAEAVRLAPGYQSAAVEYSRLLRGAGENDAALAALDAVAAGRSASSWTRYVYGLALAAAGDRREAGEFFRDAYELAVIPVRAAGGLKRAGDPNLGVFLLALGDEGAMYEVRAALGPGTPDWLLEDVIEDFQEIAAVLPERKETADEIVAFISDLRSSRKK
ncbi:tetratricopeptide repeat protein [Amycolatopsis sp. NPDC048633]|uniref:tetratricopeptide repeat protein n=1 Tax=Amycolatopsis sp. NPDC048633 TaxID=3157095 RepID=UPI0033D9A1CA